MRYRSQGDWESVYRENDVRTLPWFSRKLDPDLEKELIGRGIAGGSFLDVGTGPGTQADRLAEMGFDVTGIDVSKIAVKKARMLPGKARFQHDDILDTRLSRRFDYVLDRGCFHTLEPGDWERYVFVIKGLLNKGGLLFLKCFSKREKGVTNGPKRFSRQDIIRIFGSHFVVESLVHTEFHGSLEPSPKALFSVLRKK